MFQVFHLLTKVLKTEDEDEIKDWLMQASLKGEIEYCHSNRYYRIFRFVIVRRYCISYVCVNDYLTNLDF